MILHSTPRVPPSGVSSACRRCTVRSVRAWPNCPATTTSHDLAFSPAAELTESDRDQAFLKGRGARVGSEVTGSGGPGLEVGSGRRGEHAAARRVLGSPEARVVVPNFLLWELVASSCAAAGNRVPFDLAAALERADRAWR